jgi:hypothetical protein
MTIISAAANGRHKHLQRCLPVVGRKAGLLRAVFLFAATPAAINRHQFSLLNIKPAFGDNFPFVETIFAQGVAFVLFRKFFLLERKDIRHEVSGRYF